MFNLFKKDDGMAPDIGQEEKYDAEHDNEREVEKSEDVVEIPNRVTSFGAKRDGGVMISGNFEAEKINARIDSVIEWIKQFYERFSYMNETIGEIRAMNLSMEKKVARSMLGAEKAIDIVREVKPEQLRIDYQKAELRMVSLNEKLESNKQFMNEVIDSVNDLKRKSEIFGGTEALIKLNKETQGELLEVKKLSAKAKMQGDKVQEIFLEVRKSFNETQKALMELDDLRESFVSMKGEFEKLKINHEDIVSRKELAEMKREYNKRFNDARSLSGDMEQMKIRQDDLAKLIETSLSVSRDNKEDIENLEIKNGSSDGKGAREYEDQINEVLEVVSMLAGEVDLLRSKVGINKGQKLTEAVENVVSTNSVPPIRPSVIRTSPIRAPPIRVGPPVVPELKTQEVPNVLITSNKYVDVPVESVAEVPQEIPDIENKEVPVFAPIKETKSLEKTLINKYKDLFD
ncbi:MAG: hypothetical protein V1888_01455 [archaeon]